MINSSAYRGAQAYRLSATDIRQALDSLAHPERTGCELAVSGHRNHQVVMLGSVETRLSRLTPLEKAVEMRRRADLLATNHPMILPFSVLPIRDDASCEGGAAESNPGRAA